MSLTKQSVADLAKSIRDCRVMAVANADGERRYVNAGFVGGLESTIAHFVQQQKQDSTEVRDAFSYEPTPEELAAYRERQAQWHAEYLARKADVASGAQQ
ncbi:MAG: hypothetical protein EOP35_01680 [Rubrivivax sp.]|nr:MAG: hypothetical protein EOP35_01680 [Rubrivivax sp.]